MLMLEMRVYAVFVVADLRKRSDMVLHLAFAGR